MARRGSRKTKPTVGDVHDLDGFGVWLGRYLEALRVKNYSERTPENRDVYLRFFIQWCEERSLVRPREVTKPILDLPRGLHHLLAPAPHATRPEPRAMVPHPSSRSRWDQPIGERGFGRSQRDPGALLVDLGVGGAGPRPLPELLGLSRGGELELPQQADRLGWPLVWRLL